MSQTSLEIPSGNTTTKSIDSTVASTSVSSVGSSSKGDVTEIGSARSSWYGTCIVMIVKVMGIGSMSVPVAAVTLGWVTTMIALPLFAAACAFSGYQIQAVKLAHPELTSFAEAGRKFVGPRFAMMTQAAMMFTWIGEAIAQLIAISKAIGSLSGGGCEVTLIAIASLIVIIPSQIRDFHSLGKILSLPSTLAIVVLIIAIVVSLIENLKDSGATFGEDTRVGLEPSTNILSFFGAMGKLCFAYQGQSVFLELISEAKHPKTFTKSTCFAFGTMAFFYILSTFVAYGVEGSQVPGYLPDVLSPGATQTTVGVLIIFHAAVSYVVCMQPVHSYVHSRVFSKTYRASSIKASLHWLLITVSFIMFAFMIVNIIPFFADVNGLVGALTGAPIIFGFPSLYYLLAMKDKDTNWKETLMNKVGLVKSGISSLFLVILFPFCIFGTISAVMSLVNDVANSGAPFHC
jgi:amino acid transporter